jgi:hypothetical protein
LHILPVKLIIRAYPVRKEYEIGLFDSLKIDGKELQDCLAYFEAQTKVIAFQAKEADLYNNAMVKDSGYISEERKAVKRLSLAATEVIRRYENIENIPSVASQMHYAWHATFLANEAWASAWAEALEAIANSMSADMVDVQQLEKEYQRAWKWADEEDRKFLKRLDMSAEDIAEIAARATTEITANDSWEPELAD